MKPEDFEPGERVLFKPIGYMEDKDDYAWEEGTVIRTNDRWVFVKFGYRFLHAPIACYPHCLTKVK